MARDDFETARPLQADAPRLAAIHLAAMDSNPLLHAQFPTPDSRANLERYLEAYTAEQLRDGSTAGVVVGRERTRSGGGGEIVGFAKWDSPAHSEEVKLECGELRLVRGCQPEFLDGYAALAGEAKRRSFGGRACYCLNFVCIDPAYQGRGAGSLLTRKVLELAAADGLPVYLESTEGAVPLYEKFGFKAIDAFEMTIPRVGGDGASEVYKEVCMVWYPPPAGKLDSEEKGVL